jgi:hypothetical protein
MNAGPRPPWKRNLTTIHSVEVEICVNLPVRRSYGGFSMAKWNLSITPFSLADLLTLPPLPYQDRRLLMTFFFVPNAQSYTNEPPARYPTPCHL